MAARAVLMVSRNLPPMVGGMENLLMRALAALAERVPVDLIGPHGIAGRAPPGCRVLAELPFAAAAFLPAASLLTLRHADPRRHQLCFGGSGLMAPSLQAARWRDLPAAVYLHGLDLVHPSPFYQRGFVARLPSCDRVIVNSRYTRGLAVLKGVPERVIQVVNPAVEMPVIDAGVGAAASQLRQELGGGPILLSVGRLVARKGVAEFIEQAMPELVRRFPDLRLLVVGDEPPGGRGLQRRRLQQTVGSKGLTASVRLMGRVSDAQLSAIYAGTDLHVLPLIEIPGDVEGFGMVVLEAAARGVPSVAFDLGGVADALVGEGSGRLIDPGDYASMIDAITELLTGSAPADREALREQTRSRSWPRFGEQLLSALQLDY